MFAAFSVCCIVCTAKPKRKMCNGSSAILCLPASVLNWDKAQWIKAMRYARESSQHKWRGEEKERFNCAVRPLCYSVSSAVMEESDCVSGQRHQPPRQRASVRRMQASAECHFLITALREQRWSAGCVCWSCCAAVSVHIWFASFFHLKVNPMHQKKQNIYSVVWIKERWLCFLSHYLFLWFLIHFSLLFWISATPCSWFCVSGLL